jgi:type IV fimbrial biogenesis protein FimT
MNPRHVPSRQRGLTLVELMITIGVLAILTAIAMPNFRDFMRRNAVASHTNELLGDMRFARETAASDGSVVSICASSTVTAAVPTCSASLAYTDGWLVYKAPSLATVFSVGTGFSLLRVGQPMANASINSDTSPPISFDQRGAVPQGLVRFVVCAKGSGDTIGKSMPRSAGTRVDVQASGRAASTPLDTSTSDSSAQTLCQTPTITPAP